MVDVALMDKFSFNAATSPNWNLHLHAGGGVQLRTFQATINFQAAFTQVPAVLLNIYQVQADMFAHTGNPPAPIPRLRYAVAVLSSTLTSFEIDIRCWDATRLWNVSGVWIAFPRPMVGFQGDSSPYGLMEGAATG